MATHTPTEPGRPSRNRLSWELSLPALTGRDITGLQIFLAAFSTFRAADYLFSAQHTTTYAELAFPLWAWALACLTVAWCLLVGTAARVHFIVWLGHATGTVTYLALAIGALQQSIHTTASTPITAVTSLIDWPWWLAGLTVFTVSPIIAARAARAHGRTLGRASTATCLAAAATTTIVAFSPIIPIDGARNVGPLATVMLLHGYLAARMAPTLDTPAEPE